MSGTSAAAARSAARVRRKRRLLPGRPNVSCQRHGTTDHSPSSVPGARSRRSVRPRIQTQNPRATKRGQTGTKGAEGESGNGCPGSGRTSLWTLWWRLETLIALSRVPLARSADILHWLPDATVVQRSHARERALAELLPHRGLVDPVGLARRHWAAFLLSLVCAASMLGVAAGLWGWKDFWLSVILPIVLPGVDESVKRRRAPRGPPPAVP
ncbi:hypothetical protein [Actinomadura monticuli]|uniref:Uncharacterized protein n=1 Tax=Actinomadura monticuli TaxID=3097367 RepID=A0ABV4QLU6_9ACTN